MSQMPQFAMEASALASLPGALKAVAPVLVKVGKPSDGPDGKEQLWRCLDNDIELLAFVVTEIKEGNRLNLKSGTLHLVLLPPEKESLRRSRESSTAFNSFEQVLFSLGAEDLRQGQKSKFHSDK